MRLENCKICNHNVKTYEHYVKTKYDEVLCENCFFEMALDKLSAVSLVHGYLDEDEEE